MQQDIQHLIKSFSLILGAIFTKSIGAWNENMTVLLILILVDILTIFIHDLKNKKISSEKIFDNSQQKIFIFLAIIVAHQLDKITIFDPPIFKSMATFFYISIEGLSILENLGQMGVPLPNFLTTNLIKLKDESNEQKQKTEEKGA